MFGWRLAILADSILDCFAMVTCPFNDADAPNIGLSGLRFAHRPATPAERVYSGLDAPGRGRVPNCFAAV